MSECISSFFGFIGNLNPIKQVIKSGKKRAIFRCIFTIFTLLGQNNIRSILRVECTDVKIGRQKPPNFRRFIFLPDDSNRCALRNHNFVVPLTLVRLHARLSCASPPASLTDESLMLRHARPRRTKNVFYWVFFYAKICKKPMFSVKNSRFYAILRHFC